MRFIVPYVFIAFFGFSTFVYGDSVLGVSECVNSANVPDGKWVAIDYTAKFLCQKRIMFSKYMESHTQYQIRHFEGRIETFQRIFFDYRGQESNKQAVLDRLENARSCIEKFYSRHGLNLALEFHVDQPVQSGALKVHLWDYYQSYDAANWGMLQTQEVLSDESACGRYAHEVGHLFGLPDEYVTGACPDRPTIGPADSIMNSAGAIMGGIDSSILYPNDLFTIIKPLCSK